MTDVELTRALESGEIANGVRDDAWRAQSKKEEHVAARAF